MTREHYETDLARVQRRADLGARGVRWGKGYAYCARCAEYHVSWPDTETLMPTTRTRLRWPLMMNAYAGTLDRSVRVRAFDDAARRALMTSPSLSQGDNAARARIRTWDSPTSASSREYARRIMQTWERATGAPFRIGA